MAKKPAFKWYSYGNRVECDNPEHVLSIFTYADRPHISCSLSVGYYGGNDGNSWLQGRRIGSTGPGWRYNLGAWCAGGFSMIMLHNSQFGGNLCLRADGSAFGTRNDAVKAGLYELMTVADQQLQQVQPYDLRKWEQPAGWRLAYYLCMPEWEPMWELLEEVTRHDDWLAEVRAPKTSAFTEQLQLF